MWDIPEKGRFGHAEDQHPTPHIPQVTPGSLLPREEPSVREELQRKTATPTVHSAHSMQNISKVQKTPAFLTHQSLSIAFRTKFKLLTVGHHFVLCSRLSRHTLLLSASLGHRSCLGPLKPVLSLLAQCSPPPLHGFPGQAVAQCSQLHRESPVQNVFLWKHFPEFQSLFQLIPIFYSCFSLFFVFVAHLNLLPHVYWYTENISSMNTGTSFVLCTTVTDQIVCPHPIQIPMWNR